MHLSITSILNVCLSMISKVAEAQLPRFNITKIAMQQSILNIRAIFGGRIKCIYGLLLHHY